MYMTLERDGQVLGDVWSLMSTVYASFMRFELTSGAVLTCSVADEGLTKMVTHLGVVSNKSQLQMKRPETDKINQ